MDWPTTVHNFERLETLGGGPRGCVVHDPYLWKDEIRSKALLIIKEDNNSKTYLYIYRTLLI